MSDYFVSQFVLAAQTEHFNGPFLA